MSPIYKILLQLTQNSLNLEETIKAKSKYSQSSLNLKFQFCLILEFLLSLSFYNDVSISRIWMSPLTDIYLPLPTCSILGRTLIWRKNLRLVQVENISNKMYLNTLAFSHYGFQVCYNPFNSIGNIVEKSENVGLQHFLLYPQ